LLGSFCGTARAPAVERAELGFVQCTHICGGPHWVQASAGIAAALLAAGQATRHLLWPPSNQNSAGAQWAMAPWGQLWAQFHCKALGANPSKHVSKSPSSFPAAAEAGLA
jgi:hypothetical protein